MIKRNIFKCVDEEMLKQVQGNGKNGSHPESYCSHPEFISGSQENEEMLNQVQHDSSSIGQMPSPVQYNDYSAGQASNPTQYNGWRRTSLTFGRSMIEMLGVLAIIGVLSIGGLYAYRQAMTVHRFNIFLNTLSILKLVILEQCNNTHCPLQSYTHSAENFKIFCNAGVPYSCHSQNNIYVPIDIFPNTLWSVGVHRYQNRIFVYISFSYARDANLCTKLTSFDYPDLQSIDFASTQYPVQADGKLSPSDKELIRTACINRKDRTLMNFSFVYTE